MNIAIGTQIFLPYTQSWIYRQMRSSGIGIALVICNQKENLDTFPFEHIAVIPDRSLFLRKIEYKLKPFLKFLPYYVSRKKRLRYFHALKENNIHLLHVHFGIMAVELMEVCEQLRIPLVVTFHGFDITAAIERDPSYHCALLRLFDKMQTGIAISHEMKGRLMALGCAEEKIKVSYLGIPLQEFQYIDRTSRKGTVRFLHAGRFSATKGVPDLIRAFSAAFKKEDEVELIIAGDGEEKPMVLHAIAKSSIKNKIRFLGKLSNEELQQWRRDCDVFLLNCRTPASGDMEGLPIALLEASCTGLPIITTKHAGIPEGVTHEHTGLLVDEYDNTALSKAMVRMMDQETRLLLGKQGRQRMEEKFNLSQCNEILYRIYEESSNHNNKK
ncbi:MAG TPA: glycosyltransferase [Cytophagaceae bacterium]|jgi:colanic acid/amylovoran biosynthesis glycosyltransferase|nr:glycosyltransferase [Cytophagaceae bacterium]